MVWIYSLVSVSAVSLISLVGVVVIRWKEDEMKPFLLVLVSFSAGALLGDVFIHLLPKAAAVHGISLSMSLWVLAGLLVFFVMEKFIQWHHCHVPQEHQHNKPLAIMNLCGDGLHNFIDGMILAGGYLVSLPVGIATTIAIVLHEIPQEISDFGVLIHSGLTRRKALFFNFLSALTAIVGTLVVLTLRVEPEAVLTYLTPFTIGGFLYIAGSDLIPELHKETNPLSSLVQFFSLIAGIAVMLALLLLEK